MLNSALMIGLGLGIKVRRWYRFTSRTTGMVLNSIGGSKYGNGRPTLYLLTHAKCSRGKFHVAPWWEHTELESRPSINYALQFTIMQESIIEPCYWRLAIDLPRASYTYARYLIKGAFETEINMKFQLICTDLQAIKFTSSTPQPVSYLSADVGLV